MGRRVYRRTRVWLKNCDSIVDAAYRESIQLQNVAEYESLKTNLKMTLERCIGNVKIHFYGSRMIGLANQNSDLDIFVECGENFYADKNVKRDAKLIVQVADALKMNSLWSIDAVIETASVPVINCIYRERNLKCDITVSNGLGVVNSMMIRHLFELQPEAKKFFHFMKAFLPRYDINLNGYLLKLMIIAYFQYEEFLPSIVEVQEDLEPKLIDGWQTQLDPSYDMKSYELEPIDSFKYHVPNFFRFYATLKYSKIVLSIREGEIFTRSSYKFPNEVKRKELLISIFGPINEKHNIGKFITRNDAAYFISICSGLYFLFLKDYPWNVKYRK